MYEELNHLLGPKWHYRGINAAGDFSYVILESVEYYLYHQRSIVHFIPDDDGKPLKTIMLYGYMLMFKFVRGDGTPSEFGNHSSIFT